MSSTSSAPPANTSPRSPVCEFPTGVAVDPANGDLYVAAYSATVQGLQSLQRRTDLELPPTISDRPPSRSTPSGDVYVTNGPEEASRQLRLRLLTAAHQKARRQPSQGVAVDPSTGDVYVDEGARIARYDSTGNRLEALGSTGSNVELSRLARRRDRSRRQPLRHQRHGTKRRCVHALARPQPRRSTTRWCSTRSLNPHTRHTADFQTHPRWRLCRLPLDPRFSPTDEKPPATPSSTATTPPAEGARLRLLHPTGVPSSAARASPRRPQPHRRRPRLLHYRRPARRRRHRR